MFLNFWYLLLKFAPGVCLGWGSGLRLSTSTSWFCVLWNDMNQWEPYCSFLFSRGHTVPPFHLCESVVIMSMKNKRWPLLQGQPANSGVCSQVFLDSFADGTVFASANERHFHVLMLTRKHLGLGCLTTASSHTDLPTGTTSTSAARLTQERESQGLLNLPASSKLILLQQLNLFSKKEGLACVSHQNDLVSGTWLFSSAEWLDLNRTITRQSRGFLASCWRMSVYSPQFLNLCTRVMRRLPSWLSTEKSHGKWCLKVTHISDYQTWLKWWKIKVSIQASKVCMWFGFYAWATLYFQMSVFERLKINCKQSP